MKSDQNSVNANPSLYAQLHTKEIIVRFANDQAMTNLITKVIEHRPKHSLSIGQKPFGLQTDQQQQNNITPRCFFARETTAFVVDLIKMIE